MLIVVKKHFAFLTIFIFSLLVIGTNMNNNLEGSDVQANAAIFNKKTIVVDAGHGQPDGGTTSKNGVSEEAINLQIAQELQQILETNNYNVIMTRTDEKGIYDSGASSIREKKVSDTKNRVKIGNSSNADIFVSIHLNYFEQAQYKGWQTFYKSSDTNGQLLATCIQQALNDNIDMENERKPQSISDVYIVEHVNIPTVIVECGFLSNPQDEQALQDQEYREALAYGIYVGIQNYYQQKEV